MMQYYKCKQMFSWFLVLQKTAHFSILLLLLLANNDIRTYNQVQLFQVNHLWTYTYGVL